MPRSRFLPRDQLARPIELSGVESRLVREALAYWNARRGARTYPSRSEIVPRDISRLLRNVVLVRVLDGGADYEFRIVGDAAITAHGFSFQGLKVSELDARIDGYSAIVKRLYDRVVRTAEPLAMRGPLAHIEKGHTVHEGIYLPLGPEGGPVDHLLIVAEYSERESGAI